MPFATIDGRRLHYIDEGAGDLPLLFVHAFPLQSGMWEPQCQAFADRYRLLAPDLMGFGSSDAPSDRAAYSVDSWADDLMGLASDLALDRVVVIGLSSGGSVALALAHRHPGLVGALVLAGTRPDPDSPDDQAWRTNQQEWLAGGGDLESLANRLVRSMVGTTSSRRGEVVKKALWWLENNAREGLIGGLEALKNRTDASAQLAKLDVPVLVVAGEEDTLAPPDTAHALAAQLAQGEVVVLPGAGHLSNLESPGAFNRALDAFLERY